LTPEVTLFAVMSVPSIVDCYAIDSVCRLPGPTNASTGRRRCSQSTSGGRSTTVCSLQHEQIYVLTSDLLGRQQLETVPSTAADCGDGGLSTQQKLDDDGKLRLPRLQSGSLTEHWMSTCGLDDVERLMRIAAQLKQVKCRHECPEILYARFCRLCIITKARLLSTPWPVVKARIKLRLLRLQST